MPRRVPAARERAAREAAAAAAAAAANEAMQKRNKFNADRTRAQRDAEEARLKAFRDQYGALLAWGQTHDPFGNPYPSQQPAVAAPPQFGGGGGGQVDVAAQVAAALEQVRQENARAQAAADEAARKQREAAENQRVANDVAAAKAILAKYGLGSLADKAWQLAKQGLTGDALMFQLSETDEWKNRFKANQIRLQKGLAVIDESTYLQLESTYTTVLKNSGLGAMADNPDLVTSFLANDTSPTEVTQRVQAAWDWVNNQDGSQLAALQKYYNVGKDQLAAYILHPEVAMSSIQKLKAVTEVGSEVLRSGYDLAADGVKSLVDAGVSRDAARTAFSSARQEQGINDELAATYGTWVSGTELAKDRLGVATGEENKVKELKSKRRAEFAGSSGGTGYLGNGTGSGLI